MASIFISTFYLPIRARRRDDSAQSWQAIAVEIGSSSIVMSREEAAQLAVDLLNAVEATPVDATEQAA